MTSIKYSLKVFILFESKSEKLLLCPEQLRQLVDNNPTNKHEIIWDNKLRINAESPSQYVSPRLSGPSFWRSSGSMSPRMWWQTSHRGGPHWYLWSKNDISDWLIQFVGYSDNDLEHDKNIKRRSPFVFHYFVWQGSGKVKQVESGRHGSNPHRQGVYVVWSMQHYHWTRIWPLEYFKHSS